VSLTGELQSKGALLPWFAQRLGTTRPLQTAWRELGAPTILPPTGANPGVVGAALDYRLRYFFTVPEPDSLVAARGVALLAEGGPTIRVDLRTRTQSIVFPPRWEAFAAHLSDVVARTDPVGQQPDDEAERELARCCLLLARFEAVSRSGRVAAGPDLAALSPTASPEEQLAIIPDAAVDDVVALMRGAYRNELCARFGQRFVANPTFAGSRAVGGADGDMIIGPTLVEVKTTVKLSLRKAQIFQLIGYALLDWDDSLQITDVAFYASRIPALFGWPLENVLNMLSGREETLASLRAELRVLCEANHDMRKRGNDALMARFGMSKREPERPSVAELEGKV